MGQIRIAEVGVIFTIGVELSTEKFGEFKRTASLEARSKYPDNNIDIQGRVKFWESIVHRISSFI